MNISTVHSRISTIYLFIYLFVYLFIYSSQVTSPKKNKQEMTLTKVYNNVTVMLQY